MKPKSNSVITHELPGAGETVIKFTVRDAGELRLDLMKVAQTNQQRAMLHGFVQRIQDAAAISRSTDTGKPATPQEKYDAMAALVEHYNSGSEDWALRREAGTREGGLLQRCLEQLYPQKGKERIAEYIKGLSAGDRTALLASPKVAEVAMKLRAEATKHIDTEELLAGL